MRKGQSLVEILIAVAIGVILVIGALTIITPTLKTGADVTHTQVASALGKELLDNVRVIAEKNWHTIDTLATSSGNKYYVIASTSPFSTSSGIESIQISTTTYTRYFYTDDVYRNTNGKIDAAGLLRDPSTKKITVVYTWGPANTASSSYFTYITRARSDYFYQTDWSGGPNQNGPVMASSVNNRFATSVNADYSTTTGSLVILGF